MNTSINTYSDPKLLVNSPELVLIGQLGGHLMENRHGLESLPLCTIENIKARTETVTPTLQKILDQHWPTEHWGINE